MSDKARLEASSKRELDVGRIMLNYLYNNFQMVLILVRRLVEWRTSFSDALFPKYFYLCHLQRHPCASMFQSSLLLLLLLSSSSQLSLLILSLSLLAAFRRSNNRFELNLQSNLIDGNNSENMRQKYRNVSVTFYIFYFYVAEKRI